MCSAQAPCDSSVTVDHAAVDESLALRRARKAQALSRIAAVKHAAPMIFAMMIETEKKF